MIKLASIVFTAALGVAAVAHSSPAEARPYVSVGVGLPFVAPIVYAAPFYGRYYYGYGPYWRPRYARFGHERFYRGGYRR